MPMSINWKSWMRMQGFWVGYTPIYLLGETSRVVRLTIPYGVHVGRMTTTKRMTWSFPRTEAYLHCHMPLRVSSGIEYGAQRACSNCRWSCSCANLRDRPLVAGLLNLSGMKY